MPVKHPKSFAALIPYLTIIPGLYIIRSAWAAILLYHAAILVVLLVDGGSAMIKKLFRGWSWKIGLPLATISAASGLSLFIIWPIAGMEPGELSMVLGEYGLSGSSWPLFVIYYCISTPILEELFWRGYLVSPNRFPSHNDILFAGYHIFVLFLFLKPLAAAVVFLTLAGVAWIWRMMALKMDGLAAPLVSHLVAGVSVMWCIEIILRM